MEQKVSNKSEPGFDEVVKQDTVIQTAKGMVTINKKQMDAKMITAGSQDGDPGTQDYEITQAVESVPKTDYQVNDDDCKKDDLEQPAAQMSGMTLNEISKTDALDGEEKLAEVQDNDHPDPDSAKTGKKHKKKRSKNQNSTAPSKPPKLKPTGFEDYYVDPPIAPAEHLEEQSLYSPEKSFSERFLLAIARYASRRKFNEFRLKVFDKYLAYGGLSTGIKQFQGRVDEKAPDMTATDIAIEKSKYHLDDETLNASVVDFDSVLRGFLSSYLYNVQEVLQPEDIKMTTEVIRNFLNYLLYHDVCPEYNDQIYDAKKSCDDADHQLLIASKLTKALPGQFNQACSLLFGGHFQDTYIEDAEQAKYLKLEPGMQQEEADKIFLAGLAAHATQAMVEAYNTQAENETISITNKQTIYLEVVSTHLPSEEVLELYSLSFQNQLRPTGTVKFQTWRHPHGPWPEMSPAKLRAHKVASYERQQYELCMDADLIPILLKETRICCTCYETSFGLRYIDSIIAVLSPMYTWLNNEAMMDWIVPKELAWREKSAGADDDGEVIATRTVSREDEQEDKSKPVDGDEDDDVPAEFKKYEQGEDIIVTI